MSNEEILSRSIVLLDDFVKWVSEPIFVKAWKAKGDQGEYFWTIFHSRYNSNLLAFWTYLDSRNREILLNVISLYSEVRKFEFAKLCVHEHVVVESNTSLSEIKSLRCVACNKELRFSVIKS
jgi:hypothetical protein